jgi:hypothetical protein
MNLPAFCCLCWSTFLLDNWVLVKGEQLQCISVLSRKEQLHGFYPSLNRMQVIKLKGMR